MAHTTLLRASSDAVGERAELDATVGLAEGTAAGVDAGAELLAFTEAAVRGEPLDELRAVLVDRVGAAGAGQAVATVAAFSGLVRVADGIGIPIDDGLAAASVDIRQDLKLDGFRGAANSAPDGAVRAAAFRSVDDLWS